MNGEDGFYLKPLLCSNFLETNNRLKNHKRVQQLLDCSFHIKRKDERANLDFHRINIGLTELIYWNYRTEVEIKTFPGDQQDCLPPALYMFIPLSGSIMTVADDHEIGCHASRFHLFSPNRSLYQHWGEDTRAMLLKVPMSTCRELMLDSGLLQYEEDIPLLNGIDLPMRFRDLVVNIVNNLTYSYERSLLNFPFQDNWDKQVERIAGIFLLQHLHTGFKSHAGNFKALCSKDDSSVSMRGIEKLEAYFKDNLSAPISVDDMARVSGYTRSYLYKLCINKIGESPTAWLRNIRLDEVYRHLENNPESKVADIALLYGFGHMGRFAGYFFQRFGKYPSAMKKRP